MNHEVNALEDRECAPNCSGFINLDMIGWVLEKLNACAHREYHPFGIDLKQTF